MNISPPLTNPVLPLAIAPLPSLACHTFKLMFSKLLPSSSAYLLNLSVNLVFLVKSRSVANLSLSNTKL